MKKKVIILLPYINTIKGIKVGEFSFKSLDDFPNEDELTKQELVRVTSFFRQKEIRNLEGFNYLIIEELEEELAKLFEKLSRSIEILRFLTVDPDGKGIKPEHLTPYLVIPDSRNPWKNHGEEHFMYRIHENLTGEPTYVSYPHAKDRPPFYKDVYGHNLPGFDDQLLNKLEEELSEDDLRAITWYNKTFTLSSTDGKDKLLNLSVAFESHLVCEEQEGKKEALNEVRKIIEAYIPEDQLAEKLNQINQFVGSSVMKQLSREMQSRTGSQPITKWFKTHFYSVGSGVRHGGSVSELPRPVISKSKLGKSLWYAGQATHEFLNNVYFGQRLFKFLIEDKYLPYKDYIRHLAIKNLEDLLISDEERLKILEANIQGKAVGFIDPIELQIAFSLGGSYYGEKSRVFSMLRRLLEELKTVEDVWKEISPYSDELLAEKITEQDLSDYEKTRSFYHNLIEVDSILHRKMATGHEITEKEMKVFFIQQFIGYAVHRLV
jgi:hypothetical protein